jgi:hypothetical protein
VTAPSVPAARSIPNPKTATSLLALKSAAGLEEQVERPLGAGERSAADTESGYSGAPAGPAVSSEALIQLKTQEISQKVTSDFIGANRERRSIVNGDFAGGTSGPGSKPKDSRFAAPALTANDAPRQALSFGATADRNDRSMNSLLPTGKPAEKKAAPLPDLAIVSAAPAKDLVSSQERELDAGTLAEPRNASKSVDTLRRTSGAAANRLRKGEAKEEIRAAKPASIVAAKPGAKSETTPAQQERLLSPKKNSPSGETAKSSALSLYRKGRALLRKGEKEKARRAFQAALKADPHCAPARQALERLNRRP